MKNLFTSALAGLACFAMILCLTGCGSDEKPNDSINRVSEAQYTVPALLDRRKDLSYDEFLKIREKYNKLSAEYEKDPGNFESLIKLAEIYIYEARVSGEHPYYYNAALQTLDELLKNKRSLTKDQHFLGLFYKATVQLSQHKFDQALETGNAALALNKVNAGIYGVLVDANVELGNYDDAVADCDKMMSIRPDLRSYSRVSYLREIFGDVKGSKQSMRMAIEAGAPYSEYKCWAIITMGRIMESHNQLDSAMNYYRFATEERSNYPFGLAGIASIEAKRGNYAKADSLYLAALDQIPEIGFTIERAKMYQKQGKTEKVKEIVADIERMFREDMESGHNVELEYAVFLNEFRHDYDKALELGLRAYETRKNNIDVNRLLAYTYYAKGDREKAQKHLDIAMRTNKQDADLYCLEGLIKNDKKLIRKSFEIDPYQDHLFTREAREMIS